MDIKSNTIEIIFFILFGSFILILITLLALQQFDYIDTPAFKCSETCSKNNLTFDKYENNVCQCCKTSKNWEMSIIKSCVQLNLPHE